MTTIKCRKCGKVYPFNEKICPDCGYDIRKDETLSPRDRAALGLKSDSALFEELGKENMERWKTQTREERLQDAWENRNKFEIRPDQGGLPRVNIPMNTDVFLTVILWWRYFWLSIWLKIITFIIKRLMLLNFCLVRNYQKIFTNNSQNR